jgi:hypothetical protein
VSNSAKQRAQECFEISRAILSRALFSVIVFVVIHSTFWGIEHLYHWWCVSNFWSSMFITHSTPCQVLRDLSGLARGANAAMLSAVVSVITGMMAPVTRRVRRTISGEKEEEAAPAAEEN